MDLPDTLRTGAAAKAIGVHRTVLWRRLSTNAALRGCVIDWGTTGRHPRFSVQRLRERGFLTTPAMAPVVMQAPLSVEATVRPMAAWGGA